MPPKRRGRGRGQISEDSNGHNDEVQRSRQIDDEVDVLAASVDEMELIMVRFQRMNPQTFDGEYEDAYFEDERQYRSPHLPARMLIAAMS
ncbi:hypothetical protein F511_38921 [Dorcoceras hygrometricum]|uniref:Uncharacterized protein n=1 Tax=Dorcoceras hygrometricum TaxID=472368 RepID=A0A2Z7AJ30_9LAMI|nr:hypothetical protein F511_38921 [Dorcoceras hygrometricum]